MQGGTKQIPIDTDANFTLNSDQLVPSQKSVKTAFAAWVIDLASRVSGILPVANGGTGTTTAKTQVKSSYTAVSTMATGTTTIPLDNTSPQSTEGDQYMSVSYTPLNSANILKITVNAQLSNSAINFMIAALFKDSDASALKTAVNTVAGAGYLLPAPIYHEMTAGTTSAITFKVRAGAAAAGTTTFNGVSGAAELNGTLSSYILIEEYTP
jgi:hypothetical protein